MHLQHATGNLYLVQSLSCSEEQDALEGKKKELSRDQKALSRVCCHSKA